MQSRCAPPPSGLDSISNPHMQQMSNFQSINCDEFNRTSPSKGHHLQPINDNNYRNVGYSRYKESDWTESIKNKTTLADNELRRAVGLRYEVLSAIKTSDLKTRNRQASNTRKLVDRASDIATWKEELDNAVVADENEIELMNNCIKALEQASDDTRAPLRSVEDALAQRSLRPGLDNGQDNRLLNKEIEIIRKCQEKLRVITEKAKVQQRMTRAAQSACEMDSKNKRHAHGVDERLQQLRNTSTNIGLFPNIEKVDNTVSIPTTWLKFTQDNLLRSRGERETSMRLRGEIGVCLAACASEMMNISNSSNSALNGRMQEIIDAKNRMQAHLTKTINEIKAMEKTILMLRRAILDKEAPLKVAMTRLEERTRRIDIELCNDPTMRGLQQEVDEIRESIRLLKTKLRAAEDSLSRLFKTRSTLAHDIEMKERSLEIDSMASNGMKKNRYANNTMTFSI